MLGRGVRRVCIVGGGPSGLYTAKYILEKGGGNVSVDVVDASPFPCGLVRNGVAPDHPEVKLVENTFAAMAAGAGDAFAFAGNVRVGAAAAPLSAHRAAVLPPADVAVAALRATYDAVVVATGAESDRTLHGVPGQALAGVLPARRLVEWYNGRVEVVEDAAEHAAVGGLLARPHGTPWRLAVVGLGNVALDVVRLALSPRDVLAATDMPAYAVDALAAARDSLASVTVLGRRGPQHAACTTKEVRELTRLPGVSLHATGVPDDALWDAAHPAVAPVLAGNRVGTRVFKLLAKAFGRDRGDEGGAATPLSLAFHSRPLAFVPAGDSDRVAGVMVQRTVVDANAPHRVVDVPGAIDVIPADVVVTSIGYASVPLAGVPFDERTATVPNTEGRVVGEDGLYVVGWAKRGPRGVINATLVDAAETAAAVVADLPAVGRGGNDGTIYDRIGVAAHEPTIDWPTWLELDAAEVEEGARVGKARVKHGLTAAAMAAAQRA